MKSQCLRVHDVVSMPGIRAPWMDALASSGDALHALLEKFGSPTHVHNPINLQKNGSLLLDVCARRGVKAAVYYARKANKCRALVREAHQSGLRIDVASLHELQDTLALGIPPEDIIVTAAAKPNSLLDLICRHRVRVVVDSSDELSLLDRVAASHGGQVPFLLRLSNFGFEGAPYSRYGVSPEEAQSIVEDCASRYSNLLLEGFHFHLDGYSIPERVHAVSRCLPIIDSAREHGLPVTVLDIGGGITVRYLADDLVLGRFDREVRRALLGLRSPITFRNDGLGLTVNQGSVSGKMRLYPFAGSDVKEDFVAAVLDAPLQGSTVAEHCNKRGLTLAMETGRALLDQAGMTVARVDSVKSDPLGTLIVTLEMNQTHIRAVSADFCVDPEFYTAAPASGVSPALLFGDTCMESDVILKRQILVPNSLARGDFVVFFNTAGYHMHLFQNMGHHAELPQNVVMCGDGSIRSDGDYCS